MKVCLRHPVLINEETLFVSTRIGVVSDQANEHSETVVAVASDLLALIEPPNSSLCL